MATNQPDRKRRPWHARLADLDFLTGFLAFWFGGPSEDNNRQPAPIRVPIGKR